MNLIFESLDEESIVLEGFGSRSKPFTEKEAEDAASKVNSKMKDIKKSVEEAIKEISPKLSSVLEVIDEETLVQSKGTKIKATPIIHVKDKNALIGVLKRSNIFTRNLDDTINNSKIHKVTTPIRKAINEEIDKYGLRCELRMTTGEIFKQAFRLSFLMPKSQVIALYILKK